MKFLEELIRQAISEGKFDDLDGEGKPLSLKENPLEDPEWRIANKILADSGFAPGWIQKRREIEDDLDSARKELQLSWEWFQDFKTGNELEGSKKSKWDRSLAHFQEQVGRLNKRITAYNLETPSPQVHRNYIDSASEIEKIVLG
jgi:hypothetical protein